MSDENTRNPSRSWWLHILKSDHEEEQITEEIRRIYVERL
jgi:hypothetical protein